MQEAQENENNGTEDADELMMNEVVYFNEEKVVPSNYETNTGEDDFWYLDNGASNHMSGDRKYFAHIDEFITGKVRFGDDSRIDIKGKGSIEFVDRHGEARTMTDVYFIPDLKSNIISLGQATESGCDVRMKEDFLTMHDRDGKLLVKAIRSENRLYKVCMRLREHVCLNLTQRNDSSIWHARLGHINLETIKSMQQRELVIGVPHVKFEKRICDSCLLGKQARQVFPQATSYRARKTLELMHGDLCGPITLSTAAGSRYVFILIDDHLRYMWTILLKEKSETFNKFKRFKSLVEQELRVRIQTFGQIEEESLCHKNSTRFVIAQGSKGILQLLILHNKMVLLKKSNPIGDDSKHPKAHVGSELFMGGSYKTFHIPFKSNSYESSKG